MILFLFFSYTKTGMMVLLSSHYYTGTEEAKFLAIELPFLTCKCGQLCDNVFSLIVTHNSLFLQLNVNIWSFALKREF